MAINMKEVAAFRGNDKLFDENWSQIDWGDTKVPVEEVKDEAIIGLHKSEIFLTKYRMLYSERGLPLVAYGDYNGGCSVITVENYCKWYSLYLIMPGNEVKKVEFERLEDFHETEWYDHVPNPAYVLALARKYGYSIHDLPFEMIIGRYEREVRTRY